MPAGWPPGLGLIRLVTTDSTNAEALRRAPGLDRPTWIVADRQTAGRGRRGRPWLEAEGNFLGTLALRPGLPASAVPLLSFVAALALYDALAGLTGRAEKLALKWPNDVLLDGGKVAGILLESSGQGSAVDLVAVGIGVNLVAAPPAERLEPGALRAVSLLGSTGIRIEPETLLLPLATALARWHERLRAEGFAPVREGWLSRAARLGETITARTGATEHTGRFETLSETGALVLATAEGRVAIPAADVFF